jgi:hypothetical protein
VLSAAPPHAEIPSAAVSITAVKTRKFLFLIPSESSRKYDTFCELTHRLHVR